MPSEVEVALIPCPECGHQVSDRAPTCPSCGVPNAAGRAFSETATGSDAEPHSETTLPNAGRFSADAEAIRHRRAADSSSHGRPTAGHPTGLSNDLPRKARPPWPIWVALSLVTTGVLFAFGAYQII